MEKILCLLTQVGVENNGQQVGERVMNIRPLLAGLQSSPCFASGVHVSLIGFLMLWLAFKETRRMNYHLFNLKARIRR